LYNFFFLNEQIIYLSGDICEVSAVQPPITRFFPTKANREQITNTRETRERRAELLPPPAIAELSKKLLL